MNGNFSVEIALSLRLTRLARHFDDSSGVEVPFQQTACSVECDLQ